MSETAKLISIETITPFSFTPEEVLSCRSERPRKDYGNLPPVLVDDPELALDALRTRIVGQRLGSLGKQWKDMAAHHLEVYTDTTQNPVFTNLEPELVTTSWRFLFNALKQSHTFDAPKHGPFIYSLADAYYKDIGAIRSLGFRSQHIASLAVRHSAAKLSDCINKYSQHPDLTEYTTRTLMTSQDINYPEHAVVDYLLRLSFLRERLEEPVPQLVLKNVSLRAGDLYGCAIQLEHWYKSYTTLTENPAYQGYADWLLQLAATLKPQHHRRILSRWNDFLNTTVRLFDLDALDSHGRNRHDRVADPEHVHNPNLNPEHHVIHQENQQEIVDYLDALPVLEREAVFQVFGLEDVFGNPELSSAELTKRLGVADLKDFVMQSVIPKIRTVATNPH